uniref:UvrD-like helicase, ATP-binding domain, P-loop containing nucleoside triphosphate hydrolase n=1 Tax=Tanacetum cinerariifolium TaxID=118510 RepID=A0A699KF23_TANCI|nr:UvrD-like helicase, ATP-binding domain, P-loop containing nucleoside triphosphate hydrolase [Tanacetum cinerariifolium]
MTTEMDHKIWALANALEDEKFCTEEDMTLLLSEFSKLKVLLELSLQETDHSGFMMNLDGILDWLNTTRPSIDDLLKRYGSQEPTAGQMVVSECSSSKTKVEQKGDDAIKQDRKRKRAEEG